MRPPRASSSARHSRAPTSTTRAPARTLADAWDYEATRDVVDTDWAAVAGRRRGATQRAAVVRPARVLALPPVLDFAPPDVTDVLAWGAEPDDTALADAYADGYRDGVAVATADARRGA